jgi:hypothetical protein
MNSDKESTGRYTPHRHLLTFFTQTKLIECSNVPRTNLQGNQKSSTKISIHFNSTS